MAACPLNIWNPLVMNLNGCCNLDYVINMFKMNQENPLKQF